MHPSTPFSRTTVREVPVWRRALALVTLALVGLCATAHAQLSGNYTVGGSGTYGTIDAAVAALNSSGVSGAVTFTIASGTYAPPTGGWVINAITGTSASNTVTFKPASGATVIISGNTSNTPSGCFILNGAKYIIFDGSNSGGTDRNMKIINTNPYYLPALYFRNGAQFNVVKNCILQADGYTYSLSPTGYAGVVFFGGTTGTAGNDSNQVINNTIGDPAGVHRSAVAIAMYGQSTSYPNKGNKIIGNDIVNFGHATTSNYAYGIWVYYYNSGTVIQKNDIHMTSPFYYVYAYGIYLYNYYGYSPNTVIDGNRIYKIWNNYQSYQYIYQIYDIEDYCTSTCYTKISNNMLSMAENMSVGLYGIYLSFYYSSTADRIDIVGNSMYLGGTDNGGYYTYPLYCSGYNSSGGTYESYVNIRNNVLYNERGGSFSSYGVMIQPQLTPNNLSMDYNLWSGPSPNNTSGTNYVGYWYNGSTSGYYSSLSSWKSSTLKDTNSVGGNPQYIDPVNGNLHISTTLRTPVEGKGQPFSNPYDYDGDTRNTSTPDIGADEGSFLPLLPNDMMAQKLVNPAAPPFNVVRASQTFNPRGVIYNTGTNTASSFNVRYRIFRNSDGAVMYNDLQTVSSLASLTTQTLTFNASGNQSGSTSLSPGAYTVEFRVEFSSDQDTTNNAIYSPIVVKDPLCGTYTINYNQPASSTNYTSFTSAIADLNGLGVTCATTFLVASGTYDATREIFPLTLNAPASITATNNVTFKPASGANVTIAGTAANGILNFDQGKYYTFDGSNTTGGTSRNFTVIDSGGPAVRITNGASYNTIKNMSLRCNNSASSYSSNGPGVVSFQMTTTSYLGNSYNVIQNNLVGDTTGNMRSAIGIHLFAGTATTSSTYATNANVIDGNDIVNFGAGSVGYGIAATYYLTQQVKIYRNSIHMTTTNNSSTINTIYGIFDYYRLYAAGNDTVAYNKIYNLSTAYSSPSQYPYYLQYPNYYSGTGVYNYAMHNNLISCNGYNVPYGFYIYYTYTNTTIAHNTIDLTSSNGSYGVLWQYNYGNSKFQNNIFRRTTNSNYMFYMYYADGGTFTMDRNIYNTGSASPNYYWYSSSGSSVSTTSFSGWQSGTGKDANSIMMASIPFIDPSNYNYHIDPQPVFSGESMGAALGFPIDFDGDARSLTFPDVGADEGNFNGGGIRVVYPNGGEQLTTGFALPIQFSTNRPLPVKIQFSLDNGASWLDVGQVNPTNVGTNTFTITTPDTVVNTARMRVISQINQWEADTSDNPFQLVRPVLTMLYANGGEHLVPTDTAAIKWSSRFIPAGVKVQLDYSTNNGQVWLPIATNLTSNNLPGSTSNTYNWIVPNTPSTTALMRVKLIGAAINDVSDQTFTIDPQPSLTLTVPNGGEQWFVGEKRKITWNAVTIDYVKIEYSTNGGSGWLPIVDRMPGYLNGFDWTVPDAVTNNALIRMTSLERPRFNDMSDGPFSILKSGITVLAPNGGEKFELNQSVNVSWTSQNTSTVRVDYSPDLGQTWQTVATALNAAVGTYTFTPNAVPTRAALVRVVNTDRNDIQDQSDKPFEIMEAKSISVLAPGQGDQLAKGSTSMIIWSAPRITSVNILYSSNGGTTYSTVASNVSAGTGSFLWNVPTNLTTNGKIRIQEVGGSTLGESGIFSIVDQAVPTVKVISPNGGEKYTSGDPIAIRWTATSDINIVALSYSSDGGATWNSINKTVAANQATYSWTAPATPGTQYQVKVDGGSASDASDANFEVARKPQPMITVLSPNGGEALTLGTVAQVRWTAQDINGNVDVKVSTDNGTNWTAIGSAAAAAGTIDWTVAGDTTKQALVMVTAVDNSATDKSDGTFSIVAKALEPLIVTAPNGGESWMEMNTEMITWTGTSDIPQVNIEYSTDNGQSWTLAGSSSSTTGANSFSWKVPIIAALTNSPALVRVSSKTDASRYDVSDQPFTIVKNPLSVPDAPVTGVSGMTLVGNFPNPFANQTEIRWIQPSSGDVSLRIYEGNGRMIREYSAGRREAGLQTITIQAGEMASGVYFYELRSGSSVARSTMLIAR